MATMLPPRVRATRAARQHPVETRLDRPAPPMGYVRGLDGIRAIAVLGVLLYHGNSSWLPGGFLGVDVFFVLSGFLITGLLLQELQDRGRLSFRRFYLRRTRRLLPALLAALLLSALLVLTVARDGAAQFRADFLPSLFYVANWHSIFGDVSYFQAIGRPALLQHLWSLAVEEQFYLLWPLAAVAIYRGRGRLGVARIALVVAAASTLLMAVLSIWWNIPGGGDASRLYFGTDTHCMSLLVGAGLGAVWRPGALRKHLPAPRRLALTAVGVAGLALVLLAYLTVMENGNWLYRGGFLLVAVATAVAIAVTTHPAALLGPALAIAPLRYIGTRSYGLYLYHWPIFAVTRPDVDLPFGGVAAFAVSMALTFLVAELSYRYLEMPIRRGDLARVWYRWRDLGAGPAMARVSAAVMATVGGVLLLSLALSGIPAPNAAAVLGGVTSVGAGPLANTGQGIGTITPIPVEQTRGPVDLTAPMTAVGDSVMVGAADSMKQLLPNVAVDAEINRQPAVIFGRLDAHRADGSLRDVVIVHAGTNGIVTEDALRKALAGLADRRRVVLITVHGLQYWQTGSNDSIRAVAGAFPNVRVADWEAVSKEHGEYFVSDGTHLTTDGEAAYNEVVKAALQSQ